MSFQPLAARLSFFALQGTEDPQAEGLSGAGGELM
jgi:hypothetical protein